jgi:GAF domain-containing protein
MNSNFSSSPSIEAKSVYFNDKKWRDAFILIALRIACVLGAAIILFNWATTSLNDRILFISIFLVIALITIVPAQYSTRAALLLLIIYIIGTNSILGWGPWLGGGIFFITCVALASLLFDRHVDIYILAACILTTVAIATSQQLGLYQLPLRNLPTPTPADWIGYILYFSVPGVILIIAISQFKGAFFRVVSQTQNTLQTLLIEHSQLEDRVRERTEELNMQTIQLRTSAKVSKFISEIQDIPTLIETAARLTSEQFGYYHVGLYILDEQKKTAFLQAASSSNGKQLIGQGFRVEPDHRNVINLVIQQNRPIISSDTEDTNFFHENHFPLTRSRMVLPLTVRGEVIGVFDLHSDQPKAFLPSDTEILKTLCDLIAISYDNVRLMNLSNNLVNELETNSSFQAQKTWSKFTSRQKPAYQYTPAGVRPIFSFDKKNIKDGLRVPLLLYGQKIGTINLVRKGAVTEWSTRERGLVEKIAHQVALALENSRLVEEAQKNSLRDQMIANISNRVRETLDVESVIRTATTELRRVFDLKEVEISIGSNQTDGLPVRKKTSSIRTK